MKTHTPQSVALAILSLITMVTSYPFTDGARSCTDMYPTLLSALPQKGPPPYIIAVSMNMYGAQMELIVTIKATGTQKIRGIQLQARSAECSLPGTPRDKSPIGRFSNVDGSQILKPINCSRKTNSAMVNLNWGMEDRMDAKWTSSGNENRKIRFQATIVDSEATFWPGIRSEIIRHIDDQAEDDGTECLDDPNSPNNDFQSAYEDEDDDDDDDDENGCSRPQGGWTLVVAMTTVLIVSIWKYVI